MDASVAMSAAALALGVAVVAVVSAVRASARTRAALASGSRALEERDNRRALALRRAERLLAAFDMLEHGLILRESSGADVLRNASAESLLGETGGGSLVASAVDRLAAAALTGRAARDTLELFGPPRRTLRVTAQPVASGDQRPGALIVIEDISERKRLEAVRRDFVANISHELKTPVGALALLAETIVDEDDPNVTRRLGERMQDEAIRVGRIIEDLLDLSRIEAEETPLRETVLVGLVVAEATDRLRQAADQRRVALTVEAVDPALAVDGDRRQLVSAVHSLVENAIAYTDAGGRVDVVARSTAGRVVIDVVDTGVGIPTRDLDRIFERFYRVDRARARATGGTGLGLSIVRHVAGNHGGEVTVESQEGMGSMFSLVLPSATTSVTSPRETV